jgi:hypothetical protein
MALFVSAETSILNNVYATATINLHPSKGPTGTEIGVFGGGFTSTATSCTVSGSAVASVGASCALTGSTTYNATFIVAPVTPGDYLVTVTSNVGDTASAVFTVTSGPVITLKPSKGPDGTSVQITGTFFQPTDTTCSISSPTTGTVIAPSSAGCSTFSVPISATNSSYKEQNVTGSFIVGNVGPGQYLVQVTGITGDFAQAIFNVTAGPFIQLSIGPPKGFFSPGQIPSGPVGTHVTVEGSSFLSTDTTCTISSPTAGFIQGGVACSVFINSKGFTNVTGSFIVGNVPEGQYLVQVTGNQGDFAQALFNVTRGAFIQLFPTKGPTGTHVNIEGSFFLSTDTSCSISSPSVGIIQGAACTTFKVSSGPFLGFMNVTGSFIVGNVLRGEYVIQVTGIQGDFAQAIFNVTRGPFIHLSGLNV